MLGVFLKVGGAVGGNVAWGLDVDGDGGDREACERSLAAVAGSIGAASGAGNSILGATATSGAAPCEAEAATCERSLVVIAELHEPAPSAPASYLLLRGCS